MLPYHVMLISPFCTYSEWSHYDSFSLFLFRFVIRNPSVHFFHFLLVSLIIVLSVLPPNENLPHFKVGPSWCVPFLRPKTLGHYKIKIDLPSTYPKVNFHKFYKYVKCMKRVNFHKFDKYIKCMKRHTY